MFVEVLSYSIVTKYIMDKVGITNYIYDKWCTFIDKYNNYRPHQALDFKTPMEYYLELISEEKKVQDVFGL